MPGWNTFYAFLEQAPFSASALFHHFWAPHFNAHFNGGGPAGYLLGLLARAFQNGRAVRAEGRGHDHHYVHALRLDLGRAHEPELDDAHADFGIHHLAQAFAQRN